MTDMLRMFAGLFINCRDLVSPGSNRDSLIIMSLLREYGLDWTLVVTHGADLVDCELIDC